MEDRRARVRSLARTALAALALLLTGCGHTRQAGDGQKREEPSATPRLLPFQLQAAGTSPLALGIFDSLRGVHCRFLPDEQGALRCLPLAPPALEGKSEFADAGCTKRVYGALHLHNVAGVVGHPVAVPLAKSNCEQRYEVGTLRELASSQPRYSGTPGSCEPFTPLPPDPGAHDFVINEVTSPAAWVSGQEVDGVFVADRLRLRQFAAQGEQAFPARLVDDEWDATCTLLQLSDRLACVPPTLSAGSRYFADEDCQADPLWPADACSQAVYIGSPGDLHALGEAWQGPVFSLVKSCEGVRESQTTTSDSFFLQGEAVGLDALPATEWTNDGSERLRLRGLKTDGGSFVALPDELFDYSCQRRNPSEVHAPRYRDEEAGEGCTPVWTRDAGVRCVPESTVVDPPTYSMYADPDCTEPAYLCAGSNCSKDLVLMGYDDNGEYRAVSRNRAIQLSYVPIYLGGGGACQEGPLGDSTLLKAGEILPWDDYPELQEVNGRVSGAP